jgi:hypothetical protein
MNQEFNMQPIADLMSYFQVAIEKADTHYYTLKQAANRLNLSESKLRLLCEAGAVRCKITGIKRKFYRVTLTRLQNDLQKSGYIFQKQ